MTIWCFFSLIHWSRIRRHAVWKYLLFKLMSWNKKDYLGFKLTHSKFEPKLSKLANWRLSAPTPVEIEQLNIAEMLAKLGWGDLPKFTLIYPNLPWFTQIYLNLPGWIWSGNLDALKSSFKSKKKILWICCGMCAHTNFTGACAETPSFRKFHLSAIDKIHVQQGDRHQVKWHHRYYLKQRILFPS